MVNVIGVRFENAGKLYFSRPVRSGQRRVIL